MIIVIRSCRSCPSARMARPCCCAHYTILDQTRLDYTILDQTRLDYRLDQTVLDQTRLDQTRLIVVYQTRITIPQAPLLLRPAPVRGARAPELPGDKQYMDDTQLPCLSGQVRASNWVLETPTPIRKLEIQRSSIRLKVH